MSDIRIALPDGYTPETLRRRFRERLERDTEGLRRPGLRSHPAWEGYTPGDLRFADAAADSLVVLVTKAMPKQYALQEPVLSRLIAAVDAWPFGATAGIVDERWNADPTFAAARNMAMLAEVHGARRIGWPNDAAPGDVLRWLIANGDDDAREFATVLLARTDWSPVSVSRGKDLGPNLTIATVSIDREGFQLIAFALIYIAWREVVEGARTGLGAARLAWPSVRHDDEDTLAVMVRGALEQADHSPTDEDAVRELVASLKATLPLALDAAGFTGDAPTTEDEATALEAGILRWDEGFARFLEELGEEGAKVAKAVRTKALERFEAFTASSRWDAGGTLWQLCGDVDARPACLRFGRSLAYALWVEKVRARVETARRKPTSLVRAVHVEATLFHSRAPKYDAASRSLTFEGRKLAESIGATFDLDVITRGLGLLGSVASHELFHWEVTTGHERHLHGIASPHVIEIPGGWTGLARQLGLKEKHAHDLRAIVIAQASFRFSFPDGSRGNMLVLNERPAVGRARAHVRIELGSVLMPGYVHSKSLPPRERKLVPLLRQRVPLYGRANEHGEQRTMSLVVMAQLRDRARELVTDGGVKITQDDFTSLADRSGLPRKLIVPVRDHWLEGDTRAPPFLKKVDRDRFTLSDVHEAERAFLEEGGKAELEGATAGTKSAAKRRAKVARLGKAKR